MSSHHGVQSQEPTELNDHPDATPDQQPGGGGPSGGGEITSKGVDSRPLLSAEEKQSKEDLEKRKKAAQLKVREVEQHVLDVIELYQEKENLLAKQYYEEEVRETERQAKQLRKRGVPTPPQIEKTPPEDLSFKEIKNLVFIEGSPIHKKALEDWAKKEKLFASRVERKSTKVGNLKNEVYQLIGFFSVFQGVVLTAVSQASLLHCNNKWSPIVLSVLASIVTLAAIAQKLWQISSFQNTIYSEEAALKDVVRRSQELRREGPNFKFAKFAEDKRPIEKKDFFWLYSGVVLIFLIVFTVAFPVSHWRILCYPGFCPSPPPA